MSLLPIVERELRVAARQWRTYWGRSTAGSVAFAAVLYLIWLADHTRGFLDGTLLLKIVSYIALMFCIFAGANRTADCISSEKREDTLGLLFLTHLKPVDIVFGKLAASSLRSILFLLSTLPVLWVPVMMGGVSAAEMIGIPVSLLSALLLSMSVGLIASTLCKTQRRAMMASSVPIITLTLLLPGIGLSIKTEWDLPLAATILSLPSPIFAHEMSFNAGFGLSQILFWCAIGVQSAISVSCILASCLLLPRVWQVRSVEASGWKVRMREWLLGSPIPRAVRRRRLLERNAIFWLSAQSRFSAAAPFLFMGAGLAGVGWAVWRYDPGAEPAFFMLFFWLAVVDFYFRVRVASLSAMNFARERLMGTWEMILSTPLSVREIIRGNRMAVRRALVPSYLAFLALYATTVAAGYITLDGGAPHLAIAMMFGVFSIGEFAVLAYVAMWRGMAAHTPVHAPAQALFRVTVLPWLTWLLILPVVQEIAFIREGFDRHPVAFFVTTTSTLWLVSAATALTAARRNLRLHFRDPALAPAFWKNARRRALAFLNLEKLGSTGTSERARPARA